MSYSDLYVRPKYAPSKVLVVLAVVALSTSVFVYFSSGVRLTQASSNSLSMHKAVNVTSAQVGIFWSTLKSDKGWVIYGKSENTLDLVALDEYSSTSSSPSKTEHYVILKNLEPDTIYYYRLLSDGKFLTPSGSAYKISTADASSTHNELPPAYGKIITQAGKDNPDVDVFFEIQGAYPLYSKTGQSGEWLIPLQYLVSTQDTSYISSKDNTPVSITAIKDGKLSRIRTTVGQSHPVKQAIILGQNYMFLESQKVLSAFTSLQPTLAQTTAHTEFNIRYPRDGSVIPGTAPLIKGYGIADREVVVSLNTIPSYSKKIKIDSKGEWDVSFQQVIAPGKYTLTAQSIDRSNRVVVDKRTFTIIKSGEMVLGESIATPSATVEPTFGIIPSVATTPDVSPTPIIYSGQPSVPPPPVSGVDVMWPYVVTGAGLLFVGAGMVLVL